MKITKAIAILTGISLCILRSMHADSADLMKGKIKTKHTIELEKIVNAPPPEVFKLWTSADGVKKFFAPDAHIGTRPGDEYTILFFPKEDPEGLVHGTKGARILEFVPDKKLAFEWVTFAGDNLKGRNAPPYAPPEKPDVSFPLLAAQPHQSTSKPACISLSKLDPAKNRIGALQLACRELLPSLSQPSSGSENEMMRLYSQERSTATSAAALDS